MRKAGFNYNSVNAFQKLYGVTQRDSLFGSSSSNKRGNKISTSSSKELPGVSPVVFTKFLLEIGVFVSLSDMSENLPYYEEHPIGVNMDDELKDAYDRLKNELTRYLAGIGNKVSSSEILTLLTYADKPYNIPPITHVETGNIVYTPVSLSSKLRNKELKLLELIRDKVLHGEKVLVYYQYTNKTDIASKIMKVLEEEGIKASELTSKSCKKNYEREEWFKKQVEDGVQVVFTNAELVEVGLTLLDFNNIIFYQTGYKLFVLRQASRRSYRLNQDKDVNVYFMFYKNTVQEDILSLMASKLRAAYAAEGKFNEEGLRALADHQDILSAVAESVVNGIKYNVDAEVFKKVTDDDPQGIMAVSTIERNRKPLSKLIIERFVRKSPKYLTNHKVEKNNTVNQILNGKLDLDELFKAI